MYMCILESLCGLNRLSLFRLLSSVVQWLLWNCYGDFIKWMECWLLFIYKESVLESNGFFWKSQDEFLHFRIKSFEFTEKGFQFEIPRILTLSDCAFRILFTKFDHYSSTCKSFYPRKKKKEGMTSEHYWKYISY